MTDALRQIASGEADLTRRLVVKSRDEIGEVAHWFNTFVEHLQDIVGKVVTGIDGLGQAEETMSVGIDESAYARNSRVRSSLRWRERRWYR